MFSGDSSLVEAATSTQVMVWRLSDLMVLLNVTIPQEGSNPASAISKDGQFVALATGVAAHVWKVADGSTVATIQAPCYGVNFTQDDLWLFCGGSQRAAFSLPSGTPSPYLTGNSQQILSLAFSPL